MSRHRARSRVRPSDASSTFLILMVVGADRGARRHADHRGRGDNRVQPRKRIAIPPLPGRQ